MAKALLSIGSTRLCLADPMKDTVVNPQRGLVLYTLAWLPIIVDSDLSLRYDR